MLGLTEEQEDLMSVQKHDGLDELTTAATTTVTTTSVSRAWDDDNFHH